MESIERESGELPHRNVSMYCSSLKTYLRSESNGKRVLLGGIRRMIKKNGDYTTTPDKAKLIELLDGSIVEIGKDHIIVLEYNNFRVF